MLTLFLFKRKQVENKSVVIDINNNDTFKQIIKMVIGIKSDYHLFVYISDSVYLCNVQNTS